MNMLQRLLPFLRPPHELVMRNQERFRNLDQEYDLGEYDFVVVDTELTGLNPRKDEIVSIGAVRIRSMRVDPNECFYSLVRPVGAMPKLSTLIHRITPEEVREAPLLDEVLPKFLEYCNGALFVGHHVNLDISFLNSAIRKTLGGSLRTPCIDTMRLAKVYEEEMWENYYDQFQMNVSFTLADISKRYGLPLFPAHNAMQDALQTAYLFLYLVRKLHKGDLRTLRDLYLAGRSWRWYF